MSDLKTQIKNHLIYKEDDYKRRKKEHLWATACEANVFDIFHSFMATEVTNPMTPEKAFELGMRTKLEEAVVTIFKQMGIWVQPLPYTNSKEEYIEKPDQQRMEMTRFDVPIVGFIDALIVQTEEKDDVVLVKVVPVEIKTSYGSYQKRDLQECRPKTAYVKQLSQYMDWLQENVDKFIPALKEMFPDKKCELQRNCNLGYLFQVHFERDLIVDDIYQFSVVRDNNIFTCGEYQFDINESIYKRYKNIWDKYLTTGIEPVSEYRYKYPLDEIDWRRLPKSKIANARSNKAVIGDWQVIYSGFKDLLIEREGSEPGYTEEELAYIKEQTAGYTTWEKK